MKANGTPIGSPLGICIPQYAVHTDGETTHRTPCIVIQAEEGRGQQLIGCIKLPCGERMAGFHWEFEFFGDKPPAT